MLQKSNSFLFNVEERIVRILFSIVAALITTPASADTALPDIDVEAQCEEQARSTGRGNSQRLYCLQTEQQGYDKLKKNWTTTPEEVRSICANKWQHYSMIAFCIDDELRAAGEVAKFKFKK